MAGYICVTHATTHREESERLCRALGRYGFRYRCIDETATPSVREESLADASALLAVTGTALSERNRNLLGADIEWGLGRVPVLLLSVQDNDLDARYCGDRDERAVLISYTVGRMPDRHSVALFLHRLFVRHLTALPGCFHPERCVDDGYGRLVSLAVRAHRGEGAACYALGIAYERGERVPAIEHEAALWITRAADSGVPDARIHMGELHLMGKCRHPDAREAVRLFSAAAEAGDVRGYYHRGLCALYGLGMAKDLRQAAADLSVAARAGYAPALYRLGLLYADGIGIDRADAQEAALHCLYAACRRATAPRNASADVATVASDFTRTGTTLPWTPLVRLGEVPMVWTPVEARPGAAARKWRSSGRRTAADRLIDHALASGVMTTETATALDGSPLPPPPPLYGHRVAQTRKNRTMRYMRRARLWTLAQNPARPSAATYPGADVPGYALTALREEEALAARSFARSRYRTDFDTLEADTADWRTVLFGPRVTVPAVESAPATIPIAPADHRETYLDRASFDASAAAVALGCQLERGDPACGHTPRPDRAVVWYRYAALGGSAEACRRLGEMYRRGAGIPADPRRAAALYRLSADRGDAQGQFAYAVACEQGYGTRQDPAEAARRYAEAARAGYAPAQNNLGGCYEHGIGVVPDPLAAVEWYTRAAAAGQPDAACRLGLCYECGRGVATDLPRAIRLYESAARQGHAYALYRLGLCYERGYIRPRGDALDPQGMLSDTEDVCPIPDGELVSAENSAVPEAFRLSAHYSEAVYLWEEAARRGSSVAAYALALCYHAGHGVRADAAKEVRLLMTAAEGGHIQALYRLGLAYLKGRGTLPDAPRARACFAQASRLWEERRSRARHLEDTILAESLPAGAMTPEAAAGDALYMQGYCTLYAVGESIGEQPTEDTFYSSGLREEPTPSTPAEARCAHAEGYFRRAAALDHVGALTALGDLYAYGILLPTAIKPGERADKERVRDIAFEYYSEAVRIGMTRVMTAEPNGATKAASGASAAAGATDMPQRDDAFRFLPGHTTFHRAVTLRNSGDDPIDKPIHALMTVAHRLQEVAAGHEAEGEQAEAELAWVRVWRLLAGAAELGSSDALVSMAACSYFGHGTPVNQTAAFRLLKLADTEGRRRVNALLWLGDFHRCGWCDTACADRADEAYRHALQVPLVSSECGTYIIHDRKEARRALDTVAKAEVLYRLTTLRAVSCRDEADPRRRATIGNLAEAVLAGHRAAEDDFARIYAYESTRTPDTASGLVANLTAGFATGFTAGMAAGHTGDTSDGGPTDRSDPASPAEFGAATVRQALQERFRVRTHYDWLADYYTALALEPIPFRYKMVSRADPAALPAYVTAPVTDAMRADALNCLGDWYYYGVEVESDAAHAVALYRRVVSMNITVPRGQSAPKGLTWARYSLGWCLLNGVGTPRGEREAVKWLTYAAADHAEAAYVLAECHENGVGVDISSHREAIKYYRKALKLGCARAEERVIALEEHLRRGDTGDESDTIETKKGTRT